MANDTYHVIRPWVSREKERGVFGGSKISGTMRGLGVDRHNKKSEISKLI